MTRLRSCAVVTGSLVTGHGSYNSGPPADGYRWERSSSMSIENVTVVPGTETPLGDGVNQPVRCLVRFSDQSVRAAIVKRLTAQGVAAEAFCALLLRGWGLSVPIPAIVVGEIAFASLEVSYPNLKQRIGWSESLPYAVKHALAIQGAQLVAGLADTPRALSADEAIDNRDRNLGNILWDGSDAAWIDHERAFGLGPEQDGNKLATMIVSSGVDYAGVQTAAVAVSLSLGAHAISEAVSDCGVLDVGNFAAQVTARLGPLASRVLQRFPQPADLLNQPPKV